MLYMKSTSGADGSYTLNITFALGTDPDINTVNVQNRVNLAEPQLPEEVTRQGLTTKKVSSALLQVIQLYSPNGTYDALYLTNYGTINIIDTLKRIRGVGDASMFSSLNYSMRIWLDPNKLTSLDLTPTDVATAIRSQNIQAAVGRIGAAPLAPDQQLQLTITTQGRLTDAEAFENIIVRANPDGSVVRVEDVARVELGAQISDVGAFYNGAPSAALGIYQSPGANAVAVAEAVRATLDDLAARFPDDLAYGVVYDTTVFVQASIEEVVHTLVEAFVLVAIVVFLFLGKLRTTLIPIIAVPVSLIGTFAIMLALGFSANTVSLLALVLAIGIVVDDAIVVVENVERVMEEEPHLSAKEATRKAMGEIVAPIIAITLVLLSVFVPVAFIPGISGQLFQQFAVAVSVAMVISAINALSLSPALCSVLLKPGSHAARGPMRYVMRRDRLDPRRLRGDRQAAGPGRGAEPGRARGGRAGGRRAVPDHADRLPAAGGSGRLLRPDRVAGRRLGEPHRGGRAAGRADPERDRRHRRRDLDHRLRFPERARPVQQRLHGGVARAVRGAPRRRSFRSTRSCSASSPGSRRFAAPPRSPSTCRRSSASAAPAASSTSCRISPAATSPSSRR